MNMMKDVISLRTDLEKTKKQPDHAIKSLEKAKKEMEKIKTESHAIDEHNEAGVRFVRKRRRILDV